MTETIIELSIPTDVLAALHSRTGATFGAEEQLKVSLAIGLFAERTISLAKAAALAGMSRYEFALLLKRIGLPAYEYAQTEYAEDLAFLTTMAEG